MQGFARAARHQVELPALPAIHNFCPQVCIRTCDAPPSAGTCRPVLLELVGSSGSTGTVRLEPEGGGSGACFATGAVDVFRLEAPVVGELQQLNVSVDMTGGGELAPAEC